MWGHIVGTKAVRSFFLSACLIVLTVMPAFGAGGVGADFLRLEPPAKTAAMSNVFAGISDDINAILYNPAGLVSIKKPVVSFTHYSSFADNNSEYLCGAMGFDGIKGVFGASLLVNYTFDFPVYDSYGVENGSVDNMDIVGTFSYAYPVTPDISLGVNAKLFRSVLYKYSKQGFAFDIGGRMQLGCNPDIYAGFVLQNAGVQGAYISIADPMPINLKAGIGARIHAGSAAIITLGVDVNRLVMKDELPTLDIGAEADVFQMISIRAGYGFRHDTGNLSLGIGVNMEKVRFSYSYQPFEMLGAAHRISLDIEIYDGKPQEEK